MLDKKTKQNTLLRLGQVEIQRFDDGMLRLAREETDDEDLGTERAPASSSCLLLVAAAAAAAAQ